MSWPLEIEFPWSCAVPVNARLEFSGGRPHTSNRWKRALEEARLRVMAASSGIKPRGPETRFQAELLVCAPYGPTHGHTADVDAYVKLLLDSLEGQVLEDDQQVDELHVTRVWDADDPRLVLAVWPL